MTTSQISYAVTDGVACLTLNRPEKLNAFTGEMATELLACLDEVDRDDAVRALVVTGAGRAFCAGADLSGGASGFAGAKAAKGEVERDVAGIITLRMLKLLKPVIGAVNGAAVGIGVTMLLPMDVRIAAEEARFGFVFSQRGIVPEGASIFLLPRLVGISRAMEWCCSGEVFGAREALSAGLVRDVHPAGNLLEEAQRLADRMTRSSAPVSVALTRQMLWQGLAMSSPMTAHYVESLGIESRSRSSDAAEGVAAFLEKRPARFPDRVSRDMPSFFPWWEEEEFGAEATSSGR